ncbi:SUI1 family translation initiation factor [Flocculibacter collagenilyticus]|uniref:stress response translation initiation inhibitor YciH n=1 Tax=Flocculibacter collagenilyticus TaxID=2744479 RepID=UPI0018F7179E|nr:stress response translation initiation inhibitor YciH [Flocculibacter collagenilyticus]
MKQHDNNLVYSTESGRISESNKPTQYESFADGFLRVRKETKGRKGKGVITIAGVEGTEAELKKVAATLKKKCGCGGAAKDGIIEIQGDNKEKVKLELEKLGYKVKFSGG